MSVSVKVHDPILTYEYIERIAHVKNYRLSKDFSFRISQSTYDIPIGNAVGKF